MRLGWAMGGIVLVAAIGGCTSGDDEAEPPRIVTPSSAASAPPWEEPASYGFVLTRGCDEAKPLGTYRVTVKDGSVAEQKRIGAEVAPAPSEADGEDLGPVTGEGGEEIEPMTLGELAEMATIAAEDGGEVSTVHDSVDGHPVKVTVNVSEEGPSGAECWTISDYKP